MGASAPMTIHSIASANTSHTARNGSLAQAIRVLIIEQQVLFGNAVAHVVSEDRSIAIDRIVRSRDNVSARDSQIDVIVMDIDDTINDIEAAVAHLRTECPKARICAMSMYTRPDLMQRCLSAGVDGYIVKDSSLQELVAAIKSLAEGTSYVDPRVAANLLRAREVNRVPTSDSLSPRETDVLRLIAQGLSNRDIGQRLILSEKTVKNHISRIFSKLHFTARSQAAVHAIRQGLA